MVRAGRWAPASRRGTKRLPARSNWSLVSRAQCDVFDLATSVASLSALTFDALINRMGCHKTDDVERNAAARSSPCLDDLGGPG